MSDYPWTPEQLAFWRKIEQEPPSAESMQLAAEASKRVAPPHGSPEEDEWIKRVAAECAKLTD